MWTTTPWTLPANVAAAVLPDADYARVQTGAGIAYVARSRLDHVPLKGKVVGTVKGSELVGLAYAGPFDDLAAQEGVEHRIVAWDEVSMDEGTGIVHIAPGCGAEDFELGRRKGLATIVPVDESGAFYDGFGWLHGRHTADAAQQILEDLGQRGRLVDAGEITHRYPVCWRCGTELIYRLVDEWFIRCDQLRQPMIDAARRVEWTPAQYGKRMEDWLRNMGDWCISRKRYWGLPLPFYFCPDGHMTVIGSREELAERALRGLDAVQELHRPWIDEVEIGCAECGADAHRLPDVGDCWLDAGIIPFATLGWGNDTFVEHGYAAGAGEGLTIADLPTHEDWERWFPADWVTEMREQIRLWFYSMLFMSVAITGDTPYRRVLSHEKVNDETGRPMHKSWGNAIWFDDAVESMGADVMRWMYANQTPGQNLSFGYGPADQVKRRLLTLWNSYAFFVTYARIDDYRPSYGMLASGPEGDALQPLDRWLLARTQQMVEECRADRRSVDVVRPALPRTLLEERGRRRQARGVRHAVVRTGAAESFRGAGDAVPGRRAVAEPGARRVRRGAGLRASLGLPGRAPDAGERRAGRRDGQRSHRRRAGPPRPGRGVGQLAPAAGDARSRHGRSGEAREDRAPRRADRGRAVGQGGARRDVG